MIYELFSTLAVFFVIIALVAWGVAMTSFFAIFRDNVAELKSGLGYGNSVVGEVERRSVRSSLKRKIFKSIAIFFIAIFLAFVLAALRNYILLGRLF